MMSDGRIYQATGMIYEDVADRHVAEFKKRGYAVVQDAVDPVVAEVIEEDQAQSRSRKASGK